MNKSWSLLIIFGIIFLVVAVGWEIYSISTGARSNIDTTLVEYNKDTLFSKKFENHLLTDPSFSVTVPTSFPVN